MPAVLIVAQSVARVKAVAAARGLHPRDYVYATPHLTDGVRGYSCTELIDDFPEADWPDAMRASILPALVTAHAR